MNRRGAEERNRRALTCGSQVHRGCVHSNKKSGVLEQPRELGPGGPTPGRYDTIPELRAESLVFLDLFIGRSTAQDDAGDEFQQGGNQHFPSVDRPGFAWPSCVNVDDAEAGFEPFRRILPWSHASPCEPHGWGRGREIQNFTRGYIVAHDLMLPSPIYMTNPMKKWTPEPS